MKNLSLALVATDVAGKFAMTLIGLLGVILFLGGLLSFSFLGLLAACFGAILFWISFGHFHHPKGWG